MSSCATHEVKFCLWAGTAHRSDQERVRTGILGPAVPKRTPMRIWQVDREHGLLVRGPRKMWYQTCLCAPLNSCPKESGDRDYTGCVNAWGIVCVSHVSPIDSHVRPYLLLSISLRLSRTQIPESIDETPANDNIILPRSLTATRMKLSTVKKD